MGAEGEGVEEALERLRREYRLNSHAKLAALRRELEEAGAGDGKRIETLKIQAHRFRGSGASYGFAEVTEAADALEAHLEAHGAEELLAEGLARKRLFALLDALIATFVDARP